MHMRDLCIFMKKRANLDDVIGELDGQDSTGSRTETLADADNETDDYTSIEGTEERQQIGVVEGFYSKIEVAAIKLTADLAIGDMIEIGNETEKQSLRVASMQIDRNDVDVAHDGDSVGIKTGFKVNVGDKVYRIVALEE